MKELEWFGCYRASWNAAPLHPDAYSHPAKVSFGLAERIYKHLFEQGYIEPGAVVADPFGGIAGFAFHALMNGLHWKGCELEPRFCELARKNIELWSSRYAAHFPNWGTAEIYQGDSRELCKVLESAGAIVSSPPYAESINANDQANDSTARKARKLASGIPDIAYHNGGPNSQQNRPQVYGNTHGQLGSMKEGDISAVISSPPYAPNTVHGDVSADSRLSRKDAPDNKWGQMADGSMTQGDYGFTPGQLGTMKEGSPPAAIISSPPYGEAVNGVGEGPGARFDSVFHKGENATKKSSANGYGVTEGNLGNMPVSAVVSSPPFENSITGGNNGSIDRTASQIPTRKNAGPLNKDYGDHPLNIGNDTGSTFWQAAAVIVQQCYEVLRPGGVAVFVCGDFVRNGERVRFGRQWLALCEGVGFVGLEWIVAHKHEPGPIQTGIFGDKDTSKERVSFFRKLSNKKAIENGNEGAVILNEDVLIVRKM